MKFYHFQEVSEKRIPIILCGNKVHTLARNKNYYSKMILHYNFGRWTSEQQGRLKGGGGPIFLHFYNIISSINHQLVIDLFKFLLHESSNMI